MQHFAKRISPDETKIRSRGLSRRVVSNLGPFHLRFSLSVSLSLQPARPWLCAVAEPAVWNSAHRSPPCLQKLAVVCEHRRTPRDNNGGGRWRVGINDRACRQGSEYPDLQQPRLRQKPVLRLAWGEGGLLRFSQNNRCVAGVGRVYVL